MRFIGVLLLIALAPGVLASFWGSVSALAYFSFIWPLLAGLVPGLIIDQILFKRVPGLETFEHELTHAIAALMFFRRVTRFVVTRRDGGACGYTGGFGGRLGDDFIGMAPYVLPTFAFLSVAVRPLVPAGWFPWFDIWIGLMLGYHLLSNLREVKQSWNSGWFVSAGDGKLAQTDLGSRGLVFSFFYIPVVSLIVLGLMAAVMTQGYRGVLTWAGIFWRTEVVAAVWVSHTLMALLRRG